MISSFACKETAKIWNRQFSARFSKDIQKQARRKLLMLDAAASNRLEKLQGDRKGTCSIRINDQWRICFRWQDGEIFDFAIVYYH
ncbi:MAG: type II toxin-antitoxin system RelE/ParE family toxin [Candidatus Electronema sp. VV]